jgi:hypothetical protein
MDDEGEDVMFAKIRHLVQELAFGQPIVPEPTGRSNSHDPMSSWLASTSRIDPSGYSAAQNRRRSKKRDVSVERSQEQPSTAVDTPYVLSDESRPIVDERKVDRGINRHARSSDVEVEKREKSE